MEQFRQIGEILGSLKALMVFKDNIRINQRQCCLLVDVFNLAFEEIAEEMRQNLEFDEKLMKWKAIEHPLKELHRIFREGEQYIKQCLETKDWWAKALSLSRNRDCVEFLIPNLLWCVTIIHESIEIASEIAGCDNEEIQKKRVMFSKKYEKEWLDSNLFRRRFGKNYLVSQNICNRLDSVWREDRWLLLELIHEKRLSGYGTKQEQRVMDLLSKNLDSSDPLKGNLFPSSILVGSKDYQVRRRLGNGSQYKEIQWMGECFAIRHFFGDIKSMIPEISLLSLLAHPNTMHFLCGFSDEENKECFLLMELMTKDLCTYIKEISSPRRRLPFSLPVAVDIMLQVARGMVYLHSQKIYHGDLNPSNILVRTRNSPEGYLHIKIGGFGLSSIKKFSSRTSSNQAGTDPSIWYAPEVLNEQEQSGNSSNSKYTEKADVYSFGMLCFELLTGKVPFEDAHLNGDKMSRNIRAGERPLFPFPSPKYLTNLTKRCWQTDPNQRPSFSCIGRILWYIKRFLCMNPDHSQPDPPVPSIDFFDLETSLSKRFSAWTSAETEPVWQIPFQMFAYRVVEKEKSMNLKEKSSESGSEGASVCGDENTAIMEDSLFSTMPMIPSPSSHINSETNKKMSPKRSSDGKVNRSSGRQQKSGALRPPQFSSCGRSLRTNSESQLPPLVLKPNRRRISGHASDSELS